MSNAFSPLIARPGTKYENDVNRTRFFETVLDQVRALPGVELAATSSSHAR
jgi:hypothetical protein